MIGDIERFEIIGDLYYNRFHRLRPGKSEPVETHRSSVDQENIEQFDKWLVGNQAFLDAIEEIARLQRRVRDIEKQLDDERWGENQ
jgi:hypothetical protein